MNFKYFCFYLCTFFFASAFAGNSTVLIVKNDLTFSEMILSDEQVDEIKRTVASGGTFVMHFGDMEIEFSLENDTAIIGWQLPIHEGNLE